MNYLILFLYNFERKACSLKQHRSLVRLVPTACDRLGVFMLAPNGTPPGRLLVIASTLSFSSSTIVSPLPLRKQKSNTIQRAQLFLIHFQALLLQTQPRVTSLQRLQGSLLRRHMHRQCVRPARSPPRPRLRLSTPGCRAWRSFAYPLRGTRRSSPYGTG